MNKSIKNNLLLLAGLIVVAAVAGSSFYFGYQKGTEKPQTIVIEGISGLEETKPEDVNFSIFWEALKKL